MASNALGSRKDARAFDAEKRAKFLGLIEEGASLRQAASLSDVTRETVYTWLRSGRNGGHAEHREFAKAFQVAKDTGTHEVIKCLHLHARTEYRAALAILATRDDRFGAQEQRDRRELARLEQDRAKLQNDVLRFEAQIAKMKSEALAKLLEDYSGFVAGRLGMAALIKDPKMPSFTYCNGPG